MNGGLPDGKVEWAQATERAAVSKSKRLLPARAESGRKETLIGRFESHPKKPT